MNDAPANQIIDSFVDDDKALALALAVSYWGMASQNPNATPPGAGQITKTADIFVRWLQG